MSGTGYRDGYDKGVSDGRAGNPKNAKKIGLLNGVVKGSTYVKEWMKGYNDGYKEAIRKTRS